MADFAYAWHLLQMSLKSIRWIARVILPCLVLISRTLAQPIDSRSDIDSAGLTIEATIGWDHIVDQSTPIPVSLLLQNSSERNIEGILTLYDRMTGEELTLGEVVVAPGSTRRFTSIQPMRNWYECIAKFSHKGKLLWRRELGLTAGLRFDQNANYAMVIDNGGRRLRFPAADAASMPPQELEVAGRKGRHIQGFTAKPWQLPNHAGPLCAIQAIIIPEGALERELNQVQWGALAEWMCQGGAVFVHDKSREIIDRIIERAPLQTEAAIQSGSFMVRRFGLGAMYEYSPPLFSSDSHEIQQSIADVVANLKRNHINTFADSGALQVTPAYRANKNRFLVMLFFGIYTLLTGVALFFLFRLSQKQIAGYTVCVVVTASILSGLLGGYLRLSPGDLSWVTVTQAGIGGLVQVGAIDVQSAGSRNTRVAVKGEHTDLQWITYDDQRYRYYGATQRVGYSPFVWQRNLATSSEDTYQINVPMTLWGHRRCHATAFRRDVQSLDFQIGFEPRKSVNETNGVPVARADVPTGILSLKLVNRLPLDLTDCWLVVGITHVSSPQLLSEQTIQRQTMRPWGGSRQTALPTADQLIDLNHVRRMENLGAGATQEQKIESNFQVSQHNWEIMMSWPGGSQVPPRISRLGTASAWIIGRTRNSPIMEIDKQNTDFIPQEQIHLFIQEILPEEMPDTLQFHELAQ